MDLEKKFIQAYVNFDLKINVDHFLENFNKLKDFIIKNDDLPKQKKSENDKVNL